MALSQSPEAKRAWAKAWRDAHPGENERRWAEWRANNPEKVRASQKKYRRKRHLRDKYGMEVEDYERMLIEQGGVCAICGSPPRGERPLDVDHDHTTNAVRALLCGACNKMLAGARDSESTLARGIAYLERFRD